MTVGEHEAVAVGPVGIRGIMAEDPGEQDVGQRGQGHSRTGMAGVGMLGGVHRQAADHVDAELLHRCVAGDFRWSSHCWSPYRLDA